MKKLLRKIQKGSLLVLMLILSVVILGFLAYAVSELLTAYGFF